MRVGHSDACPAFSVAQKVKSAPVRRAKGVLADVVQKFLSAEVPAAPPSAVTFGGCPGCRPVRTPAQRADGRGSGRRP